MDSYSNKINRIKFTIDEIREDIEQMKKVIYNIFIINNLTYIIQKKERNINNSNNIRNNPQVNYDYFNVIEGQNINNNNTESSQASNEFTNLDYNKMDLYDNQKKASYNSNINEYDNGRDNFYKRKSGKNKNNFLKGANYTGKHLNYNHNSNINIHNKNNINDYIDFDDNNKEELFKKYETIHNQGQYGIINPNIDSNSNKIMQMNEENYLYKKNNKLKKNVIDSNENENIDSFDMNDNNLDNIDNTENIENINSLINNNKVFRSNILNKNNNDYNNSINKYQNEINKLKKEIENLENSNDILSNQLKEEEKRNEELNIIKNEKEENDNSILLDISHCLQVNSFDEILPRLTEMINYLNKYNNDENSKIKEDLISKLKSLYIATTDSKESKDNISIQDLWRWIKQLIDNVKQLSIEKEKNEEIYKKNNYEIYKKYCEKLIKEFGLNSFDELKFFINDLLTKNNINKKRVEKLRKVLMNNNEKEESSSSGYNNNEENENDYDNMVMNHNEGINGNNNISNNNFNFKYH